MRGLVKPGDVVLDIGAHKGSYLYWLQRAVGPAGRVLAFEPQPALAAYLQDAVRTFGWRHVEVRNEGVSDRAGELVLSVPAGSDSVSPEASFEERSGAAPGGHEVRVAVTSLDAEFPAGSKLPTFIKIDVEGHEHAVFAGARRLLESAGPALLFECEQRHLRGRTVRDVFASLEALGYSGRFIAPDGLRPLSEFREAEHQSQVGERFWDRPGYCNNFVFTRR